MTDLELIKRAAQVTTDADGNRVVQIPLDLWEDYLELVEPDIGEDVSETEFDPDNPPPGSLALLAKLAREANINTGETDTSSRSREILENEYADYLLSRMNRGSDDEEQDSGG